MDVRTFRRVITGHDEHGQSCILFDGTAPVSSVQPGGALAQLWATSSSPADNQGTADAALRPVSLLPPRCGSLFWIISIPPRSSVDAAQAMAEAVKNLGAGEALQGGTERPGWHTTNTVDYLILLSGEVTLQVDLGETTLRPFDSVVQRGTSHNWENRGSETAVLAIVLLDARPYERAGRR
jgi:hypothetical protein